jgi:hypothetical protein
MCNQSSESLFQSLPDPLGLLLLLFFFFFGITGVLNSWIHVLLGRCSAMPPTLHSTYFGDRVSLFAQADLDHNPPIYVSHGKWHARHLATMSTSSPPPPLLRWCLMNFFFTRAGLEQ